MSKKRSCDENVETPTTAKRVNIEHDARLWKLVTDHPNVFDAHIVTKLNGNDVKFFYDVNRESRAAIKRSGVRLPDAFEIGDFATKSTLSWALEKCSEKKERFCAQMALNGNFDLLKFLHENECPWNEWTCANAAKIGHFECLKYLHENGCPWDKWTCEYASENGHLECLKYLHEKGCPWNGWTCSKACLLYTSPSPRD